MTSDIHNLDQYIGKYVSITDGRDSAAGCIVDVFDALEYGDEISRWVVFDWGQSWRVLDRSVIEVADPPPGDAAPEVESPIRAMHRSMEDEPCANPESCPNEWRAASALYAFRVWRTKQTDAYWRHAYVRPLRGLLGDPDAVGDLMRDAMQEGAPVHIVDHMKMIVKQAQESPEGMR